MSTDYKKVFDRLPKDVSEMIDAVGFVPDHGPKLNISHHDRIFKPDFLKKQTMGTVMDLNIFFNIKASSERTHEDNQRGFDQINDKKNQLNKQTQNRHDGQMDNAKQYIEISKKEDGNFKKDYDNANERVAHNNICIENGNVGPTEFIKLKCTNLMTGRLISLKSADYLEVKKQLIKYEDKYEDVGFKLSWEFKSDFKKILNKTDSHSKNTNNYFDKFGLGVYSEISAWPVFDFYGQYDQTNIKKDYSENTTNEKSDSITEVHTLQILSVVLEEKYAEFSDIPLERLRLIYHAYKTKSRNEAFKQMNRFFQEFGSAVNFGKHIFGGYKDLSLKSKGKETNKVNIKQNEKNKITNMGVDGQYSGKRFKAGVNNENNEGIINEINNNDYEIETNQFDNYRGGIIGGTDDDWVQSLQKNNKLLTLIESEKRFVSVYNLLLNYDYDKDIDDIYDFAKFIAKSYEKFSGFRVKDLQNRDEYLVKMTMNRGRSIASKYIGEINVSREKLDKYCKEVLILFNSIKYEDPKFELVEFMKKQIKLEELRLRGVDNDNENIKNLINALNQKFFLNDLNGSLAYIGDLIDGKKHGKGVCYYQDEEKYDGEWNDDKQEGNGVYSRRKKIYYNGKWKNGKREGDGTFYYWDSTNENENKEKDEKGHYLCYEHGGKYVGECKNDKREGNGTFYMWSNKGSCVHTKTENNGEEDYYYSYHDKYVGEWKNDKKDGYGVYYHSNGDEYEGNWIKDFKDGHGVYNHSNGDKYEGNWIKDFKDGHGVYVYRYPNGYDLKRYDHHGGSKSVNRNRFFYAIKYEGEFEHDAFNGKGTMYYSNEDRYEGEWIGGFISKGILHYSNGDKCELTRYMDTYMSNYIYLYDEVIYHHSNGDRYEGEMKHGMKNGNGIFYCSNGDTYKATWENGNFEGEVEKTSRGIITTEKYKNGKKQNCNIF